MSKLLEQWSSLPCYPMSIVKKSELRWLLGIKEQNIDKEENLQPISEWRLKKYYLTDNILELIEIERADLKKKNRYGFTVIQTRWLFYLLGIEHSHFEIYFRLLNEQNHNL